MRVPTALGELYVEDVGEGSPIVLFHSYIHHGGMWKAQVDALKPRHRVINIDGPGHGRSTAIHRPFSLEECARAVVEVMDACKVPRAAMAGLSWGGMVAMQLALLAPERLSGLALFDTSCRSEPARNRLKYQVMGMITRSLGAVPSLLDRVEPLFFSERSLVHRRELVDPWRAYVARMDRLSVWHALECIMGRSDISDRLRRLDLPTLVAVGANDRAQPVAESEHIAKCIPRAQLAIVSDAAHLSAIENPGATNALLLSFLARL